MLVCDLYESSDDERASICRNIEPEYRLQNIAYSVPLDHLHPVVKMSLEQKFKNITIYRGVPDGVNEIRPGDWVALTKRYAAQHGSGNVISMRVPMNDVAWAGTDQNEYYYVPETASS